MAGPTQRLIEAFEDRFKVTPHLYRAPGRVNLIGEHTDYTQGFVLPIAIHLGCFTASAFNEDSILRVESLNLGETREWPVEDIPHLTPAHDWTDYVIGVAWQIPQNRGRNVIIYGTVPVGSGLSSSAALEVSTALALGWNLQAATRLELAQLCRRAENDFVGLPSGIMDQYVSVFGEENAALKIDCRSLEHLTVPLPAGAAFVAVDSLVKHALGASAYRDRVAECRQAEEAMGKPLRDATLADLERIHDPVVLRRARHVITENRRVEEFVAASAQGTLEEMGRLFVESHRSLQHDYEVSCEELDFLVDTALGIPGVYGARMTGGGFGGCTVNLMAPSVIAGFEERMRTAYQDAFGKEPAFFPVKADRGASILA